MAWFGFPDHLSEYTLKDYLRIVVIIGGYLVLRPHLVKIGERMQKKQYEEQQKQTEDERAAEAMQDTPENAEKKKQGEEEEEEEGKEKAESSGGSWGWGNKAKNRQAKAMYASQRKAQAASDLEDDDVSDLLQTSYDDDPSKAVSK